METIFTNTENSKTSESYKFRLALADKFDLKNPNKNMAFANLIMIAQVLMKTDTNQVNK